MHFADLVAETATCTGTSNPYSVTAAISAANKRWRGKFATASKVFAVAKTTQASPNGAKVEYFKGTLTYGSPDTISRDTIMGSSNADAAVDWSASDIIIVYCAPLLDVIGPLLQPTWLDNGAAGLTITAAHFGRVVEFDVTAANRVATMTAGATLGHGFRCQVYGYGSTSNSITLTPASGEAINEQAADATLAILGGVMKTVAWDDTKSKWRVW